MTTKYACSNCGETVGDTPHRCREGVTTSGPCLAPHRCHQGGCANCQPNDPTTNSPANDPALTKALKALLEPPKPGQSEEARWLAHVVVGQPQRPSPEQALQRVATGHMDNADATLGELATALKAPADMSYADPMALKLMVRRQTVILCRAALELVRETIDGLVLD